MPARIAEPAAVPAATSAAPSAAAAVIAVAHESALLIALSADAASATTAA